MHLGFMCDGVFLDGTNVHADGTIEHVVEGQARAACITAGKTHCLVANVCQLLRNKMTPEQPDASPSAPPPAHEPTLLRGQKTAMANGPPSSLDPNMIVYPTQSGYWDYNDPGTSGDNDPEALPAKPDPLPSRASGLVILAAHLRFGH